MPSRVSLPIDPELPGLVRLLKDVRSLVIVAEPGAGKTTRVPPAILAADLLSKDHPNLVMLQPRRVAARAAAARIAEENDWRLGHEVGYHIRFEKRLTPQTRLRILTEGVLTRQLLSDPFLEGVGAVVLDEFHERSLHSDLAVAMLREMRHSVREDLVIVIMSATLEAEKASAFLGNCPIVRIPGRQFPVQIDYAPRAAVHLTTRVADAVTHELQTPGGDILVFLPGAEEIRRTARALENTDSEILPLHGSLPPDQQMQALRPAPRRKVILSTNIAETSLTIDGVTIVVDSGLARVPAFDPRRGLDRLELQRISKASAAQRAGRAGRTAPGRCVRLWSQKEQAALHDFELPEIRRVDLCAAVLDLHAWGKPDPRQFGWFEPPAIESLDAAEKLLQMLGALSSGKLTPIGKRLLRLPVHPRLGRLLAAAAEAGCPDQGADLAALLSEKNIFRSASGPDRRPAVHADSDLLIRLEVLNNPRHLDPAIDSAALRQAMQAREELRRLARRLADAPHRSAPTTTLLKLVLLAFPDRVCRRRQTDPATAAMVGGGGVRLTPESVVRKSEFFLALDPRHDPRSPAREAAVSIASLIRPEWLEELFPQSITRQQQLIFDSEKDQVIGLSVVRYLDLILSETRDSAVDLARASEVLAESLQPRASEIFSADPKSAAILNRVAFLRKWMPEHSWPKFDSSELFQILTERCQNKKSLKEILAACPSDALLNRLPHPLDRFLDLHAPRAIQVPTGNHIEITYAADSPPTLAVRLQEIFGWNQTPRLAGGRVPIVLHLLGPNFRPVQITSDLQSFWANAYFQVRKDLRVRYPKHSWPEDPLTAVPQAKGRHRPRS
ncbi:MAG: ATP-dependent helicase HrpB [Tepidisphaeraceae bacterium]|jgi:ATP-dependent helicase HrpB